MSHRKPTQKDLAELTGLSQGLISLVMNGEDVAVADATRQKILEAAKQIGYQPRQKLKQRIVKRKSVRNKQPVLAYISPVIKPGVINEELVENSYLELYAKFQNKFAELAARNGYSLLVRPHENSLALTSWLIEWGVDGVILHSSDASLGKWIAARYPLVEINRKLVTKADAVMLDQNAVMGQAMDHLRENGHQRIAYLYPTPRQDNFIHLARKQAYLAYTRQHGLHAYEEYLKCREFEDVEAQLFHGKDAPTSIITSDPLALRIQRKMLDQGKPMPESMSLIGIDNIAAGVLANPALTSIDIAALEVAEVAFEMITQRILMPGRAYRKIEVSPHLIKRGSVASVNPSPEASGILPSPTLG